MPRCEIPNKRKKGIRNVVRTRELFPFCIIFNYLNVFLIYLHMEKKTDNEHNSNIMFWKVTHVPHQWIWAGRERMCDFTISHMLNSFHSLSWNELSLIEEKSHCLRILLASQLRSGAWEVSEIMGLRLHNPLILLHRRLVCLMLEGCQ